MKYLDGSRFFISQEKWKITKSRRKLRHSRIFHLVLTLRLILLLTVLVNFSLVQFCFPNAVVFVFLNIRCRMFPLSFFKSSLFCNKTGNGILAMRSCSELLPVTLVSLWLPLTRWHLKGICRGSLCPKYQLRSKVEILLSILGFFIFLKTLPNIW